MANRSETHPGHTLSDAAMLSLLRGKKPIQIGKDTYDHLPFLYRERVDVLIEAGKVVVGQ